EERGGAGDGGTPQLPPGVLGSRRRRRRRMAKVTVEVVTPEKRILSAQADEAIVPGAVGLFGVRPGHTPLLSVMSAGPLTLKNGGSASESYFVAGGFVEVSNDKVMVLADH